MNFETDIFEVYDKKWALLTAGTMDRFNTMTISWGSMGTLWGKPVATVYVRTSRYTHDFMDDNDYFTVSFYPSEFKKTLGVLGSRSGREIDKMHIPGMTPCAAGESVSFEQAEVTLLCKKLCSQLLDPDHIPADIVNQFYTDDAPHNMFIGEVVDIIRK
ncbi:MAG: flavin reductase [Clostridiales bacterium]|nr:flavin reductase [Clostridiales bacterium]